MGPGGTAGLQRLRLVVKSIHDPFCRNLTSLVFRKQLLIPLLHIVNGILQVLVPVAHHAIDGFQLSLSQRCLTWKPYRANVKTKIIPDSTLSSVNQSVNQLTRKPQTNHKNKD
jgi:hypothetical protein